ncbi:hypothetical protein GEMRC1_012353 [Eukaryota sp. GEM-RC1]
MLILDSSSFFKHTNPRSILASAPKISHWQLRDLMREYNGIIYFTHATRVFSYNLRTTEKFLLLSVSFFPTCLDVNHGYVVTGGQRGELNIYHLSSQQSVYTGRITQSVVNSLQLVYYQNSDVMLTVSTNDSYISMYMLPSMERLPNISFNDPVNHTSVSPNGKLLATVGDHNLTYLYGNNNGRWTKIHAYNCFTDAGMTTDWNWQSLMWASASQDGTAVVNDVRYSGVLKKVSAYRHPENPDGVSSSFRSCKFSKCGTTDLLAFSQHRSYVMVCDARNFADTNVLNFGRGVELAGLCFVDHDRFLMYATEDEIGAMAINLPARLRSCDLDYL